MTILISIALFPLLIILIFFTYKEYKVILGIKQLRKSKNINIDHYEHLSLKEVPVDYRIVRGQKAFLVLELNNTYKAQAQRMYTGHTKGGIRLPFFTLSTQKKRFYQQGEFISHGPSKLTVTNRLIRIQGTPFRWTYNLKDIEQLKFIDNNKTLQLSTMRSAWPVKMVFSTKDEAELFLNTVWTCYHGKEVKDEK